MYKYNVYTVRVHTTQYTMYIILYTYSTYECINLIVLLQFTQTF